MQDGIVYQVSNWILYMMISFAISQMCERRLSFWKTFLIQGVSAFLNLWICLQIQHLSTLRFLVGTAMFLIVNVLLHKGRLRSRILYTLLLFTAMILSEIVLMAILPHDEAVSGEMYAEHPLMLYSLVLFVNAVVLGVMLVLLRSLKARYTGEAGEGMEWLILLAFPIGQMAILWVFWQNYLFISYTPVYFVITLAIFIASDVALIASARVSAKNGQLRARADILEEEVGFQKEFYEQLSSTYEGIRRMRHDIDNHLYTMQALLADGKVEEASEYAGKVAAYDTAKLRFAECRNMVAASYLEKKAEDLQSQGVPFETDVRLPAGLNIANPDLICVLGNLLDNAQEACRRTEEPRVILKAAYQKPYLSISCRNTAALPDKSFEKRRIPELERGVGFTILRDIARRYDGEFRSGWENGWFQADMILKDKETETC